VEVTLMGALIAIAILPLIVYGLARMTMAVIEPWEERRRRRRGY
jgi:uncharacterized protein (DUF2062 family)